MRVVVVGLGYVGSVCSACLAERGHDVVGVDTSEWKVARIRAGESPIVEKGLPELIAKAARAGKLTATTRIAEAMPGADVGAGVRRHAECSRRLARSVARQARVRRGRRGAQRRQPVRHRRHAQHHAAGLGAGRARTGARAGRGRQGRARVRGRVQPRVPARGHRGRGLLRSRLHDSRREAASAPGPHCSSSMPASAANSMVTPIPTAEMLKYVNNSFHALKVTFANEFARLCKREGRRQPRGHAPDAPRHQAQPVGAYLSPGLRVRRLVPAQGPARASTRARGATTSSCRCWPASCSPMSCTWPRPCA